jgi:PEGA domain
MTMKVRWAARAAGIAVLFVTASLVAPQTATARPASTQAEAEAHIQKGLELRRKGRDADALVEFEEAMKTSPSARAKAQVGLAQMATGLFEAAEVTLSDVLSSSADDSWVSAHRAALNDALAKIRGHLGTFNASGEPQGATVEMNGTPVGSLPCSVHVQAGDVVVKVVAPGFIPITRTVSVEARRTTNQVFNLVSASPSDKADDRASNARALETPPREKARPAQPVAGPGPATATPSGESPGTSHASSPWPWIAAGGSLLALSFGGVEAVRWASKASDFNNMKGPTGAPICDMSVPMAGGSACATLLNDGHTARALAIGGFAVGAALGVTAIILFVRDSPGEQRQALSCLPAVGTPGVVCATRF